MASLNDRDAGRDFEGNGPSSFDARSYRVEAADVAPLSAASQAAVDATLVQIGLFHAAAALPFAGFRKEAA